MAWGEGSSWTPGPPGGGSPASVPEGRIDRYNPPSGGGSSDSRGWASSVPVSSGGDVRNIVSGSGGAPAGNQQWGSFVTYGNWEQAFQGVHGRSPNVQDEADYWDSQIFAAAVGRPPNQDEWENRYYRGGWQGGYGWRGADTHDENFLQNMLSSSQMPDIIRGGFQQWVAQLPQRPDTPGWLAGYAAQVAQTLGTAAPAGPISPTDLPASQVQLPGTPEAQPPQLQGEVGAGWAPQLPSPAAGEEPPPSVGSVLNWLGGVADTVSGLLGGGAELVPYPGTGVSRPVREYPTGYMGGPWGGVQQPVVTPGTIAAGQQPVTWTMGNMPRSDQGTQPVPTPWLRGALGSWP